MLYLKKIPLSVESQMKDLQNVIGMGFLWF